MTTRPNTLQPRVAAGVVESHLPAANGLSVLGYCPHCGSPGRYRETWREGNDACTRGHVYPSERAVYPRDE